MVDDQIKGIVPYLPLDAGTGRPDVAVEAEVGGELEDRSLLCDEAVGPGFDDESVDVFGPHLAPEALRGLDDRHVDPGLEEVVGGDEPGDPASHHYDGADLRHLPWLRSRRRTGRRSGRDGR